MQKLDSRLECALSFVRKGGVVLDVGTDHAYLVIEAIKCGLCSHAVASDINEGPLDRAKANSAVYGVSEKINFYLCDGINGTEPEKNGITDIVICGMGGELISRIISDCEYTKKDGVRLILQPMTKAYELRRDLLTNGFEIIDEKLCKSQGRVYTCICVEYIGKSVNDYTESELTIGRHDIINHSEYFDEFINKELNRLNTQIKGLENGGHDAEYEKKLYNELKELIK